MRKLTAALLVGALAVTSCGAPDSGPASAPASAPAPKLDAAAIAAIDSIAAMLPEAVRARGVLRIGTSVGYPPAEFLGDDLRPIGYDIDLGTAIGRVLGIPTMVIDTRVDATLRAIGKDYDVAISSLAISPERVAEATMISYMTVGSAFGVRRENYADTSVDDLCGKSVGVLSGAREQRDLDGMSARCTAAGTRPITVSDFPTPTELKARLISGDIDLMYAASTVTRYASSLSSGAIQHLGGVRDAQVRGVAVAKSDPALATAVQKAMQHLMDTNRWDQIAGAWGVDTTILNRAVVYPRP